MKRQASPDLGHAVHRQKTAKSNSVRWFGISFVFGLLALVGLLGPQSVAEANHHKTSFPTTGLLDVSSRKSYNGNVYVATDNCNWQQRSAFNIVESSTNGDSNMERWPNGIDMQEYTCSLSTSAYVDMWIDYKDESFFLQENGSYIGGRNEDNGPAPSWWCSFFNTTYPCGVRPTVEINEDKYAAGSTTYKKRLIIHETGHSMGLSHHCNGDSIMNYGASSCNGGKFTTLNPMEYWPTDRLGISNHYPAGS